MNDEKYVKTRCRVDTNEYTVVVAATHTIRSNHIYMRPLEATRWADTWGASSKTQRRREREPWLLYVAFPPPWIVPTCTVRKDTFFFTKKQDLWTSRYLLRVWRGCNKGLMDGWRGCAG